MLRIGIVVGEPSGDTLGAGLVRELRKKNVRKLSWMSSPQLDKA